MKKASFTLLLSILFLVGCNLPANSSVAPTADVVATQVSVLLTAQPSATSLPPTETTVPQVTAITPTQPLTATPEPSPTATVSPDDPAEYLGSPDFSETFDTGKGFGLEDKVYDDDYTFIRVENGALWLTSKYATGYHGWRTGGMKVQDAYIEGVYTTGDCSNADTYGLVFRSPDYIKGYWFSVTCNGSWEFGYWDGSQYVPVSNGTADAVYKKGSNQTNRLGVMASGSDFKFFINGKLIAEANNSTFSESGSSGAMIAAFTTPNFTVKLDNLSYWQIN